MKGPRPLVLVSSCLAAVLGASPAAADFLRASRTANVYIAPDRQSAELAKLSEGDEVLLLSGDKQNGYYPVRAPNGTPGFVYKSLVRRIEGDPDPSSLVVSGAGSVSGNASHSGGVSGVSGAVPVVSAPPPAVRVTAERISMMRQFDKPPLGAGQYRVYLFDLGTGLSVLVQGADFNLLFDGGSGDDAPSFAKNEGAGARLLAYLWGAIGPSGGADCVPEGEDFAEPDPPVTRALQHVFLSHPHLDHGSQLDEVLRCYDVQHVWEPGVVNDTKFYERFVQAVAAEPALHYHTVAATPSNRIVSVGETDVAIPSAVTWSQFAEGEHQVLGHGAFFDVLFADGSKHSDFNQNSLVVRVQLGDQSLLLMGDAEAGLGRGEVTDDPTEAEAHLLRHHPNAIDVDILQVGHHGSLTSSRRAFLEAVSPKWALLSAGPKKYGSVTLPDDEVVEELERVLALSVGEGAATANGDGGRAGLGAGARLLRTDVHDARLLGDGAETACENVEKVGRDEDQRAGGCDGWRVEIW